MSTRPSKAIVAAFTAAVALVASCRPETRFPDVDLRSSGVGIVAEGCALTAHLASGFVLDHPSHVVTVAHAIAGATSISVVDSAGVVHRATVRAFDKDRDLAVLDVPGLHGSALHLGPSTVGPALILTWGRDAGVTSAEVNVSKRLTVTIEDIYLEEIIERRGIEVLGDVHSGDSGGPVVSSTGDVIGIIYAQSRVRDRVGFATDSSELDALLRTTANTPVANGRCG